MIFSFKLSAALLFFALGVSAAPAELSPHLSKRDVWSPPIISPDESTVWCRGAEATVTWNATNPPSDITNFMGAIYLGHLNKDGSGSEHLEHHPLGTGFFNLTQGDFSFVVPTNVNPGDNYIVVLMGDSGNVSQNFTIKQCV